MEIAGNEAFRGWRDCLMLFLLELAADVLAGTAGEDFLRSLFVEDFGFTGTLNSSTDRSEIEFACEPERPPTSFVLNGLRNPKDFFLVATSAIVTRSLNAEDGFFCSSLAVVDPTHP